jgi:hypothetical protein
VIEEHWADGHVVLPGGILDRGGGCHKTVRVRELTGKDEEILADRRYATGAQQVTDLLAHVITGIDDLDAPIDRELVGRMLIGDRDYLILRLRQMTAGDAVHQVMRCQGPACGRKVDVEFLISEIPVRRVDRVSPTYELTFSRPAMAGDPRSVACVLRLPTGHDHEIVASLKDVNAARANTALFARVILRIGQSPSVEEEEVREFPLVVRRELADFLQRASPGPDLTVSINCPHCGEDMTYPFDLAGFFFSEWAVKADTLYEQVHHLAFHYHWGETEILGMTRARRHRYLRLLAQRIEQVSA